MEICSGVSEIIQAGVDGLMGLARLFKTWGMWGCIWMANRSGSKWISGNLYKWVLGEPVTDLGLDRNGICCRNASVWV